MWPFDFKGATFVDDNCAILHDLFKPDDHQKAALFICGSASFCRDLASQWEHHLI